MYSFRVVVFCFALLAACSEIHADENSTQESKPKIKKNPLDFTENDVDKLFNEWEDNDEDVLPEDERHDFHLRHPHGKHPPPALNPVDMAGMDREKLMKMTKKGQTVMMFATVSGKPTRREAEEITNIWWSGLKNALFDVNKYIVDDDRVLFVLPDGSQAYEVKDFLVSQDRCQEVTIDNRPYYGKGAKNAQPKRETGQDL